jgi:hypothetical protein
MADEYATKPTLETLLERMNGLEERLFARLDHVEERLLGVEERLFIRLDRIESEVKQSHSELYALRADFTELRAALKEHLPALKP